MKTSDFDYHLPPHLIAQHPVEPRDQARLLVLSRPDGAVNHARFSQLADYLRSGDLLVCNDSRVIPARLVGRKAATGGKVELLLLRRLGDRLWEALAKPGRRLHPGVQIELAPPGAKARPPEPSPLDPVLGETVERTEASTWLIRFDREEVMEELGQVPLPPYIHSPLQDPERYQTVYARVKGSVAAPTAGLHFTPHLLQSLARKGIGLSFLTAHIGLDTFRPVAVEDPRHHPIHAEWGELPGETAQQINRAKAEGRRVVAVGTSTVRLLETAASREGSVEPFAGWTRLFILPGYKFQIVDALITNFHLPRTTLLMLVSAFAGRERILEAYQEAIRKSYGFYSFGDTMLIL